MDNQHFIKTDLQEKQFFSCLAKDYLTYFGNPRPSVKQMVEMQALLSYIWVRRTICFDQHLTIREKQCLYLAAQGKGIKETASFLKISVRRVMQHRQIIFQKLGCKNIVEAVTMGIRLGEINLE